MTGEHHQFRHPEKIGLVTIPRPKKTARYASKRAS
ncbi:hypothetical protein [Alicyclobacillus shizuokensis]|nr:hypothetical protein [Alicyclobacillus shizuokensis]